jgi:hypothetical protein
MFYKTQFEIEDWLGPFEGWTDGRQWNGWECPAFEFDAAVNIMEAWNAVAFIGGDYEARYDAGNDEFCFRGGGSDWDCFRAVAQDICGKRTTVYPIGAYCWIWNQAQGGPAP